MASTLVSQSPIVVAIVVGETSGDILGVGLMKALCQRYPNCRFVGVAGPLMQAAGCETWFAMDELAVMGLVEVLHRLPRILSIRHSLKKRLKQLQPDVFIGIDAPDFNIPLEYYLKKQGIKTVHYVSPSVWAWRQKRVFKIVKAVDMMLAFLPFEKAFYDRFNVPCRFVGHTMADAIALSPNKLEARQILGIAESDLCLAILPGSRHSEVEMLSSVFIRTVKLLRQQYPKLKVLVPLVNRKRKEQFIAILKQEGEREGMMLLDGQAREAMQASDATLLASGTAALECMLVKCPMVVAYRVKPFTHWLLRKLVKTKYVSLPNLLAGKMLVPELIQDDCHPEALSAALIPLLSNEQNNAALKREFLFLHEQIRCNADQRAADAVMEVINQ